MTPERWQQIKDLFHTAQTYTAIERTAVLATACANDEDLRQEVESLLDAHEQPGAFLEPLAVATTVKPAPLMGQMMGPYQIEQLLDQGGMGVVYLARDTRLGRPVALKLLPPHFTQNPEHIYRFQQEARAVSALNHPNILTIYEVGQIEAGHFIATEFIAGQTLRELMAQERLSLPLICDIALQVADALQAAHEAGIIHRDIKPENLMVRPDGYVKVLDFGLAKLRRDEGGGIKRDEGGGMKDESEKETLIHPSSLIPHPSTHPSSLCPHPSTASGGVMGTAAYMSPEQARGDEVDARTDIFSLGVVLYELIAGQTPFGGATSREVLTALLQTESPPLAQIPAELQRIVSRALRKERAARYQHIAELRHDLKALKSQLERATESRNEVTATAPRKLHRRLAPVLLGVVALLAAYGLWRPSAPTPIQSVAVLPFKPLVSEQRDEVLELGIADTLITRLSNLKQITVRPISAVRPYTALAQDSVAAGRELQVQAVLEGNIQKVEQKIRVTARLIQVADGKPLWTRQFDEQWTNIFAVQDAIAQRFADDLVVTLTGAERSELTRNYTANPAAYELYLNGRYHWNKRSAEGIRKSLTAFQQAIAQDPQYALAYVGLADAYATLISYHLAAPKEVSPLARAAAETALRLAPDLAEAHASRGKLFTDYDWDAEQAEKEFLRALELKPNYPNAHHWYSTLLVHRVRFDEAVRAANRALELDPQSLVARTQLGSVLYRARRYDEAVAVLQKTLDLEPNYVTARHYLARCYLMQARQAEALAEFQKCHAVAPNVPDFMAMLGYTFAVTGNRAEALRYQRTLHELAARRYVSPFCRAVLHAGLGEKDEVFQWLEKCLAERDPSVRELRIDPLFDPVRTDARFAALLQQVEATP